jgi:hypothetical protein
MVAHEISGTEGARVMANTHIAKATSTFAANLLVRPSRIVLTSESSSR